ncbi:hypothetical protein [Lactococcus allomyrinae]|nr:hypothetical protein [Lactococcus allomyrinae]
MNNTHHESQIDFSKPQFIILYKVGCPYCNAAHQTIEQEIKDLPRAQVHFVEVRSHLGKQLVQRYQVQKAHTIIVTRPKTDESTLFEEAQAVLNSEHQLVFSADKSSIQEAIQYFKGENSKGK